MLLEARLTDAELGVHVRTWRLLRKKEKKNKEKNKPAKKIRSPPLHIQTGAVSCYMRGAVNNDY